MSLRVLYNPKQEFKNNIFYRDTKWGKNAIINLSRTKQKIILLKVKNSIYPGKPFYFFTYLCVCMLFAKLHLHDKNRNNNFIKVQITYQVE